MHNTVGYQFAVWFSSTCCSSHLPGRKLIVLIAFAVQNFRSYRDRQEINLLAAPGRELLANTIPLKSVSRLRKERVLRSAVIYGANASGKSNLVLAMNAFLQTVASNLRQPDRKIVPFRLNTTNPQLPTQ